MVISISGCFGIWRFTHTRWIHLLWLDLLQITTLIWTTHINTLSSRSWKRRVCVLQEVQSKAPRICERACQRIPELDEPLPNRDAYSQIQTFTRFDERSICTIELHGALRPTADKSIKDTHLSIQSTAVFRKLGDSYRVANPLSLYLIQFDRSYMYLYSTLGVYFFNITTLIFSLLRIGIVCWTFVFRAWFCGSKVPYIWFPNLGGRYILTMHASGSARR